MVKIKILDQELTLEEAKELYFELHKLFGNNSCINPRKFDGLLNEINQKERDMDLYGPEIPESKRRSVDDYHILLKD